MRAAMPAIIGVLVAIAITTTMDATGYTNFSALPLFPLAALFWAIQRFSRREIGLTLGTLRGHGLALLHPIVVLGAITLIAWLAGAIDPSGADWTKARFNMLAMSSTGILAVLLTEEGFFRGWLWAALRRAGHGETRVLVGTSLAFSLWHVSMLSFDTGFQIPAPQVPVYLLNATLIGAIWGMLRMISGSALVPSVAHAVWNGIDYPLFGFGTKVGALGIERTDLFGPEVGLLGLAASVLFAAALWYWMKRKHLAP